MLLKLKETRFCFKRSGINLVSHLPLALCVFIIVFALYAATAAPGVLFGDPSEYQFIPAVLGIAHPPGYAFYTLLAKLWQVVVPIGSIPFRTNLLAAAIGAWAAAAVYLIVRDIANWAVAQKSSRCISLLADGTSASAGRHVRREQNGVTFAPVPNWRADMLVNSGERLTDLPIYQLAGLFAALSLAVAPDFWQHAIHSNAHIVSAALALTHLWLLIRWWRTGRDRWLAAFAVTLGFAAAHHPITLMGLPAYGVFVLAVRPQIWRQWRTVLLVIGCLLLGLSPLLYYPLRSPSVPFGPTDMNTLDGFLRHVTARGLRGNLFHFGLADQPHRALVFWSLLRLQFPLPVIALMGVGLIWIIRRTPKPAILFCLFLITHLLFTLNTVQDVMAYLLLPFAALAILAGVGALALIRLVQSLRLNQSLCNLSFIILLLSWPLLQGARNLSRGISLRDFTAAEEWVAEVQGRFAGRGEGAILLSDWEHFTPLMADAYTRGGGLSEEDLRPIYASTAKSWPAWVWEYIEAGPIYLPDDRAAVRREGFRLVPEGAFYRVEAPPVTEADAVHKLSVWAGERVHILGHDLPQTTVRAGEPLVLTLYQSVPEGLAEIWMPYAELGPLEARWTTDSRLLTNQWLPGEIVAERYELPISYGLPPGEYPLRLGYADLTGGRGDLELSTGGETVKLATISVTPNPHVPPAEVQKRALANLDNQVALMSARACSQTSLPNCLAKSKAVWEEPLVVRGGDALRLILKWRALTSPRDSATIFIHLIDGTGRPVVGHDYTPLGGSAPTYLWFPKWLPGQTYTDPYRLEIPADTPPGEYWLEVGMYGMTSLRRFPVVDLKGNLAGDRVILGSVRVE